LPDDNFFATRRLTATIQEYALHDCALCHSGHLSSFEFAGALNDPLSVCYHAIRHGQRHRASPDRVRCRLHRPDDNLALRASGVRD
jgi:hypothetical protein